MAPITWRNVSAPSFSDVAYLQRQGAGGITDSFSALGEALSRVGTRNDAKTKLARQRESDAVSARAQAFMSRITDAEDWEAMQRDGGLAGQGFDVTKFDEATRNMFAQGRRSRYDTAGVAANTANTRSITQDREAMRPHEIALTRAQTRNARSSADRRDGMEFRDADNFKEREAAEARQRRALEIAQAAQRDHLGQDDRATMAIRRLTADDPELQKETLAAYGNQAPLSATGDSQAAASALQFNVGDSEISVPSLRSEMGAMDRQLNRALNRSPGLKFYEYLNEEHSGLEGEAVEGLLSDVRSTMDDEGESNEYLSTIGGIQDTFNELRRDEKYAHMSPQAISRAMEVAGKENGNWILGEFENRGVYKGRVEEFLDRFNDDSELRDWEIQYQDMERMRSGYAALQSRMDQAQKLWAVGDTVGGDRGEAAQERAVSILQGVSAGLANSPDVAAAFGRPAVPVSEARNPGVRTSDEISAQNAPGRNGGLSPNPDQDSGSGSSSSSNGTIGRQVNRDARARAAESRNESEPRSARDERSRQMRRMELDMLIERLPPGNPERERAILERRLMAYD